MAKVQSGSFRRPDEVRNLDHGRIELVNLGEMTVGRQVLEPGWRWSTHVKPVVGTSYCEFHHVGLVMAGHLWLPTLSAGRPRPYPRFVATYVIETFLSRARLTVPVRLL